MHEENRIFDGLPTMAIIFYNGQANWNPLAHLEEGYPNFFRGRVLPFVCSFVNMADIPDSDCLACKDTVTGLGITSMKYSFDKDNLLRMLPQFKDALQKMPPQDVSCLLNKISVYLTEYIGLDIQKELDMAFKSIGQKYGFVSAGDVYRKKIADAQAKTQKAEDDLKKSEEDKLNTAKKMVNDGIISIENATTYFGYSKEQILR